MSPTTTSSSTPFANLPSVHWRTRVGCPLCSTPHWSQRLARRADRVFKSNPRRVPELGRGPSRVNGARSRVSVRWALLLVVGLTVIAGCGRSPEAQTARHLQRGDGYFGRKQYHEAVIEYRNVLEIEASHRHALQQVGFAHYELGEMGQAFPYLLKSKELSPESLDVRLKLGAIYLLGVRPKEAQEEAAYVLDKDPKRLEALLLMAWAARTPEEVGAALRRLEAARADFEDRAKFQLALASLYFRKQDPAATEAALTEAVTREPKSVDAHLALGEFYVGKGEVDQAEREFKAAADLVPVGSLAGVRLADFYVAARKPDEAKRVLAEILEKAPAYLPARRRLAEIAFPEGKYDESETALEAILAQNPSDPDGLLLRGRVRLARRQPSEAIEDFQKVLKLDSRAAPAHYQLALAQLQAGNLQQAKSELTEALAIAPDFVEATLVLGELNIQTGAPAPAIEMLEKLIAKHPNEARAYVLLGSAYLANREPGKATDIYRTVAARAPGDPRGPYLVGVALRAPGKGAPAAHELQSSL